MLVMAIDFLRPPIRRPKRIFSACAAVGIAVVVLAAVASCASKQHSAGQNPNDSSTDTFASDAAGANIRELCKFVSDIDSAANAANGSEQMLAVLQKFQPRFANAVEAAPDAIKPWVRELVDASNQAIKEHNPTAAATDSVSEAGYKLDRFCRLAK